MEVKSDLCQGDPDEKGVPVKIDDGDCNIKLEELDLKEEKPEELSHANTEETRALVKNCCQITIEDLLDLKEQEPSESRIPGYLNRNIKKEPPIVQYDQNDDQVKQKAKRQHLGQKRPKIVNQFKCDHEQCNFQSIYKFHYQKHLLLHRNPEELTNYKCVHCDFRTIHKASLRVHSRRHKNLKDVVKFRCNECDYQTIYKHNITRHAHVHKNAEHFHSDKVKCVHCICQTFLEGEVLVVEEN